MSHFSWGRMAQVCLFAAIPSGLFAVDGVVLIDQNRALAGSVTPGDAPGFPVTISQPGSYRLTGNLTVADMDTTAIEITSAGVTLDLNGFALIGPAVCTGIPAVCPAAGKGVGINSGNPGGGFGPANVRVLNGSVRGMGSLGIQLINIGGFVERVHADSNAGGGLLVAGTVLESTATNNGTFGILAITVRDCNATQNNQDGIILDGSGGVGTGNISSFNGGRGMNVPNGTATGNTMVRNSGFGISSICQA